jgi:hypothetical protein
MIKKIKFRFVKTIFCVNLIRSKIKKTITASKGGNKTKINLPLISYHQHGIGITIVLVLESVLSIIYGSIDLSFA